MNTTHTPGPWRLHETERHPWVVECPTTHPDFYGQVCTVGFLPNARLIAAAPDYDAAAREFVAPYAEVTDAQLRHAAGGNQAPKVGAQITVTIDPEIAASVLRFRAVIAKTEGP